MSCSMPGCSNSRRFKPEGVSFHTIPRGELKKEWLQILGKDTETWVWTKNKVVCSQHFTLEDFVTIGHQNILKMDAVPSITSCSSVAEIKLFKSEDLLESSPSTSGSFLDPLQSSSLHSENISVQQELEEKLGRLKKITFKILDFSETRPDSTTTSDSSQKRQEIIFLKSMHNYSTSPEKIKSKYTSLQQKLRLYQRKLYKAKRKISLLQKEVTSLKIVIKNLKHQNPCS